MRLLLLLSAVFTISHVYSRTLPDLANSDSTLLPGETANALNSCGGPTSQSSSSTTDQEDLQTHKKRADPDLPDRSYISVSEDSCPAVIPNPRMTKEEKMDCPNGFFVYHLCCRGPTEETGGLYPNILNCRFSTSKLFLIAPAP